ncbi:MAG: hypothetical protein UT63_C0024G0003 [Candidatus Gottesmanbacteria bacterium GW2011_GWC2_39_8]|uniref:Plasmid stabilization system n=1 Tax=Candidatus Gottesmanbacteria bacterium GW2011_GWC2_39_8 TaxID=1618450 RepID=A0A0G0Q6U0_9BACT|nr:MAG: hypothetical protein UT63_C0024G0003 [Candidatus Gottesmanbacteria bacterium GW2011_GWC2_39_8]
MKLNFMYEIRFSGAKAKKDFKNLLKKCNSNVKRRLEDRLKKSPYLSANYSDQLSKIEKKQAYFCYPLSGSNRILYIVIEEAKTVMIFFSGNDDAEQRFLKFHGKKKVNL